MAQTRLTGGGRAGEENISNGTSTPTWTGAHHSNHAQTLRRRLLNNLAISRQVLPGVSHLLKSMTAAKYILTTMTALSLTWLPWLITLSTDIVTHTAGEQQLSLEDEVEVQRCVYDLLYSLWSDEAASLQCPLGQQHHRQDLLSAVHAYHQVLIDRLQNIQIIS